MATIKTAELVGPALDWAVAKCDGIDVVIESVSEQAEKFNSVTFLDGSKPSDEAVNFVVSALKPILRVRGSPDIHLVRVPDYSTDWSQGGPIIEREKISICHDNSDGSYWAGYDLCMSNMCGVCFAGANKIGQTPLIAAMRCFVSCKLGDEVEVPDELVN